MRYDPLAGALGRAHYISFDQPAGPIKFMTLAEQYDEGAQRYRGHAARQTVEGRHDHAASSLMKAEHKDRMARRVRCIFDDPSPH